jgi:hypothetical protein
MVFCFVQNFFFGQHRVRIFIFFVANFFSPEFDIRLFDKNSESDFFFPPPKSEFFFQQHWESEYFFRQKPYLRLKSDWSHFFLLTKYVKRLDIRTHYLL